MHSTWLLVLAAATVAVVHSILPDHWVPLTVVGRTQRWRLTRVARLSALASVGHVVVSLLLAGIVALVGLRFRQVIDVGQGKLVGGVLVLTGTGFLVWGLRGGGHHHDHDVHGHHPGDEHLHEHPEAVVLPVEHEHEHEHGGSTHTHAHAHEEFIRQRVETLTHHAHRHGLGAQFAAIAVPFGVAASPDLTILPVALAAGALGTAAVVAVLLVFSVVTIGTFVGLTTVAAAAGYQVQGVWLEDHANLITSLVLIGIGVVAFIGF